MEAAMDIKRVLVPVTGTDSGRAALDAAFVVADHLGARLEGLHVRRNASDALAYIGEGMTGTMIEELLATAEDEANTLDQRAREDFAAACEKAGFKQEPGERTARLHVEVGREEEAIALHGRLADLIVVARAAKDDDAPMRATLEAALLESGRPLFVAPPSASEQPLTSAAIGWNGSAEAARAATHALPFLAQAERVAVISVEEGVRPGPSADDLVAYLALHGVAATTQALKPDYRSTGEALLAEAAEMGAGLLVIGAYTHSRLRRMIFGSATEHMLGAAEIPVVMMN
jgi:nucleotide-binding universal stress UspA family protein